MLARMLPVGAVALTVALVPASAQAARCGAVTKGIGGPVPTNIVTAKTTCKVGRAVAKSYATGPAQGRRRAVRDGLGRTWRCRVTKKATGSDPGFTARTKVRCTRSRSVVRFELRS